MAEKSSEQMRILGNFVHIAGILAELSYVKEGTDKNGNDFISIRGAVQCSPDDASYTAYFSIYNKEKTNSGADNKLYKATKAWLKTAVPMTQDKENASLVDLSGSIGINNYVGSDGTFNEVLVNNIKFFNNFKDYAYEMSIEGYIKNITDEEDEEGNATGRKKLTLISNDGFMNALKFEKNEALIIPVEYAEALDDAGYEIGRTVTVSCERHRLEVKPKVKAGGFGKQPALTTGKSRMVWVLVGGDPALEEDDKNAISSSQIKQLLAAQASRNDEIIARGYISGNNDGKNSGTVKKGGFGKKAGKNKEDDPGYDDMPF